MSSFGRDIEVWAAKTKAKINTVQRRIALEGFRLVIINSPVDTGRFRGNWNIGIGRVDLRTTGASSAAPMHSAGTVTKQPPRSEELTRGIIALSNKRLTNMIIISNNLPYALRLEAGYSPKASSGILRVSYVQLVGGLDALIRGTQSSPFPNP